MRVAIPIKYKNSIKVLVSKDIFDMYKTIGGMSINQAITEGVVSGVQNVFVMINNKVITIERIQRAVEKIAKLKKKTYKQMIIRINDKAYERLQILRKELGYDKIKKELILFILLYFAESTNKEVKSIRVKDLVERFWIPDSKVIITSYYSKWSTRYNVAQLIDKGYNYMSSFRNVKHMVEMYLKLLDEYEEHNIKKYARIDIEHATKLTTIENTLNKYIETQKIRHVVNGRKRKFKITKRKLFTLFEVFVHNAKVAKNVSSLVNVPNKAKHDNAEGRI